MWMMNLISDAATMEKVRDPARAVIGVIDDFF